MFTRIHGEPMCFTLLNKLRILYNTPPNYEIHTEVEKHGDMNGKARTNTWVCITAMNFFFFVF